MAYGCLLVIYDLLPANLEAILLSCILWNDSSDDSISIVKWLMWSDVMKAYQLTYSIASVMTIYNLISNENDNVVEESNI